VSVALKFLAASFAVSIKVFVYVSAYKSLPAAGTLA